MAKPKLWVAELERGDQRQRMQFEALDKADATEFAEAAARREAEWVASHDDAGERIVVEDDAAFRKAVRDALFKVVRVEQA